MLIFKLKKVKLMALSSFLNINGYDMPCPRYGFEYILSTAVDSGRNLNAAVVGQRVGRELYKFNTLQWVGLYPEQIKMILSAIEPFFVPVTFEDIRSGGIITIDMYPGDRTVKPLFVDKDSHSMTRSETLSFNLVDCGWPIK